jgi:hypothetical protein
VGRSTADAAAPPFPDACIFGEQAARHNVRDSTGQTRAHVHFGTMPAGDRLQRFSQEKPKHCGTRNNVLLLITDL